MSHSSVPCPCLMSQPWSSGHLRRGCFRALLVLPSFMPEGPWHWGHQTQFLTPHLPVLGLASPFPFFDNNPKLSEYSVFTIMPCSPAPEYCGLGWSHPKEKGFSEPRAAGPHVCSTSHKTGRAAPHSPLLQLWKRKSNLKI